MNISPYCPRLIPELAIGSFYEPTPHLRSTYLCATLVEEGVWVHAIADSASDKGEPVEDHGGLMGLLEEELAQHIDHDR